ncbi:unnamed protein product [Ectocarpus sp. CCAP 1310/34]|nr:unnamed protein product [Ectocarpus sp. CCAP 1310/34]
MSENGPSSGAAAPTPADTPKNKSRSAPLGSRRRAARKLNQDKTRFEERTGQCMVAASAEDNTRRAIERGSLTVVERTLEETKEELVKSRKMRKRARQASCSMAMESAREKDEELKWEWARRQQAEQKNQQAKREKEAAAAGRRQAEERVRAMSRELTGLKDSVKSLRNTNATLLEDAGIPIVADDPHPEKDSTRSLEDELLLLGCGMRHVV